MSVGTASSSYHPQGAYDANRDNYCCNFCRQFVYAPKGSPGLKACPTPGCSRPTGFGAFAKVPRPKPHTSQF
jgi:hypothetical protein